MRGGRVGDERCRKIKWGGGIVVEMETYIYIYTYRDEVEK